MKLLAVVTPPSIYQYRTKKKFPGLKFCGPKNKPHGLGGLGNHYHIHFDTKLVHVTCAICFIYCTCNKLTSTIDKPWTPGVPPHIKPHYQPVKYCTYWPVFGFIFSTRDLRRNLRI